MKHYYRKAIPLNKVATSDGTVIPFDPLTDSHAFKEFDDAEQEGAYFISEINRLMKARTGGIEEITEEQYNSLYVEKKSTLKPLLPNFLGGLREGRETANPAGQTLLDTANVRVSPAEVEASKNQPTAPKEPAPAPAAKAVSSEKPTVGKLKAAAVAA